MAMIHVVHYICFFFFQAEDGIRDYKVTGVQTCALPICSQTDRHLVEPARRCQGAETTLVTMPEIYCVRADFGTFAKHFVNGGYVAIGWTNVKDLSSVKSKEELYPIYMKAYPEDTSNIVVGQQVGQMARFLFDIQAGDYVITPDADTELLHVGVVESSPAYFYGDDRDGCRFRHRRPVKWVTGTFKRSAFSVPFQNTIRSALTVLDRKS